jgi:hypothetical protein
MFGSEQCQVIAPRTEMSDSNTGVHTPNEWIKWAEALDVSKMLERHVGFAIYDPHPAT